MWKKPFKSRSSILKTSERKKLKEALLRLYPALTAESLDALIPSKGDSVTSCKVQASYTIIYSVDNEPLFFDADSRNTLYPTVYALWKLPPFMDSLYIHPATFQYLARGADLMARGVLLPSTGIDFLKNSRMAVVLAGSNVPIGVGYSPRTELITTRAQMVEKALIMTHIFGDELWKSGSKQTIDESLLSRFETQTMVDEEEEIARLEQAQGDAMPAEPEVAQILSESLATVSTAPVEASSSSALPEVPSKPIEEGDASEIEADSLTTEQMDALVVTTFLQALKKRVKAKDLPLLASKFWVEYCLPSRPRGSVINWKKSSWKKLLPFLEEQVRNGLIGIHTTEQGVTSIVAIVRDHPSLEAFRTMNVHETAQADMETDDEEIDESKPVIQDLWMLHKKLEFLTVALEENEAGKPEAETADLDFLKAHLDSHSRQAQYFTKPQITGLFWKYVTLRELADAANPKNVKLDANLCSALYPGGKSQVGASVAKKDLAELFNAKIIPIQIVKVNGEVIVEKGNKVGSILVLVESRGGSKLVTRVQGLHHFGLDFKEVSKKASKRFASSAGQSKDATGQDELLLQGNLEKTLPSFLTQEFNIPAKVIKLEVKNSVKKKGGH
jgi:predicted ribosome-associated RNA-binding protein Tma20/translation initiation factor 1 (eIF-1/SUI1)